MLHVLCPWFEKAPHPLSMVCLHMAYYTFVLTAMHCLRNKNVGVNFFNYPVVQYCKVLNNPYQLSSDERGGEALNRNSLIASQY
jgi:hypothetical protein